MVDYLFPVSRKVRLIDVHVSELCQVFRYRPNLPISRPLQPTLVLLFWDQSESLHCPELGSPFSFGFEQKEQQTLKKKVSFLTVLD